ncbi:stage III sporulation protein SpoIIIAB [Paraliobacillus sp. JSM ZJ581]|uniref:stage III sporulation protein SpoIIIAB n=1 Tax=Paraliobacillus sp. JSM ZJ581 TaxID=3342118 RepID=UPI0035A84073
MKWLGALLLLIATTWIGFEIASYLNNRPKQIRQLKSALQTMEAEIVYSHAPLIDAFWHVANQSPEPIAGFFQMLHQQLKEGTNELILAWSKAVGNLMNNSALSFDEKEILIQFGQTLGQHDISQQKKYIQLALTHLDRVLEDAVDDQHRYSKMVKSLGFLTGLFIILLLI